MLNKSILLNIQIGGKTMSTALGLCILESFILCFFSQTLLMIGLVYILAYAAVFVYSIKSINKVFYTSLFDDEGTFYMALPVSAKDMMLGKAFSIAGFLFIEFMLFNLALVFPLTIGAPNAETALSNLSDFVQPSGNSTGEVVVAFAMYPLVQFIEIAFQSVILLSTFVTLGTKKKKLLLCWIVAILLLFAFGVGDLLLANLCASLTYGTTLAKILSSLAYVLIGWAAIKKSIHCLEQHYQM